jgi:glycosyltransferase involved in cell wall biosynthesis
MGLPTVSLVIPVLDEEDGLLELHRRVEAALEGIPHELVFVDDGSTDRSAAIVEELAARQEGVVLVQLSRNFGMEIAMSAGLDHARGDHVVLMHADLQDPPELIPEMLEKARAGADVVYTRRIGRDESWFKRSLATGFYKLMERLARTPYQGQAGDFRLMSRRVVETLRQMPERRRFLRGMVAWVGYEQVPIEYRRAGRASGRGASYHALLRLAVEALASFSDVPLALAAYFGIITAVLSGLGAFVILVLTIFGVVTASLGVWILMAVLFLGGVQLISVGILGRYVARMHEQTLQRPLYLVNRVIASPLDAAPGQGAGTGGTSSRSR